MTVTHTPGPWTVTQEGDRGFFVGNTRLDVCVVGGAGGDAEVVAEDAANARLIAAAPDLLTACEAVLAVLDDQYEHLEECRPDCQCPACNVRRIARSALAQAKGGAT